MSSNNASLVNGEFLISGEIGSFTGATAHIILEDVSLLDTSAHTVAQQTISDINHEQGTTDRVGFSLYNVPVVTAALYSVRVHVTFHRDGQIHRGDYISTQSYPVLTQGHPSHVLVTLTKVT